MYTAVTMHEYIPASLQHIYILLRANLTTFKTKMWLHITSSFEIQLECNFLGLNTEARSSIVPEAEGRHLQADKNLFIEHQTNMQHE